MKVYSTKDVSRLLGISVPQVRAQARAGFLRPERGPRRAYRFSFQDLFLLKSARALAQAKVSSRRIRRALRRLRQQLPRDHALTEIRIIAENGRIVVRDGSSAWNPESGQMQLDFKAMRAGRSKRPGPAPKAVLLDHAGADDLVRLGKSLYEQDQVTEAVEYYRKALALRRNHSGAAFHLGVALEDLGKPHDAIEAYRRAVENDPYLAQAHFNLARLYEQDGKKSLALRHLKTYRQLSAGSRGKRGKNNHRTRGGRP